MMSGRTVSISLTPAAKMNPESSALYTEGTGKPIRSSTSSMPFSSSVTRSAFSDEKQMAPSGPMASSFPSSRRSLSFAVMIATFAPASWKALNTVGVRSSDGSFIMTSRSFSRS